MSDLAATIGRTHTCGGMPQCAACYVERDARIERLSGALTSIQAIAAEKHAFFTDFDAIDIIATDALAEMEKSGSG